jgi:predicted Zn-dependent protease with MMP-like domain
VTAGASPEALVPRDRLDVEVDRAVDRLTARAPTLPPFTVEIRELPPAEVVDRSGADDVAAGVLLGTHEQASTASGVPDAGTLVVVLYARPLLLWADQPAALRTLVRQTLAAQLADATGADPDDLDPESG